MSILSENDYKKTLKARLLELKSQNRFYSFQNLAHECRVQKTYLSKVFNDSKTHLSPDQLYLAMTFLGYSDQERDYLDVLYQWQRADLPARKSQLKKRLQEIQKQFLRTDLHVSALPTLVQSQALTDYYLDPETQLVHMFFSLDRYTRDAESLRKKLDLSEERFSQIITRLLQLQMITVEKKQYRVIQGNLHLASDSPLQAPYKNLLRLRSQEQIRKLGPDRAYNYSVIFTASTKDRDAIRREFLEFVKRFDKIVRKAPNEDVFQLSFDLFDWS
jgi:hypothetical protein